jgi:putative membrane protein
MRDAGGGDNVKLMQMIHEVVGFGSGEKEGADSRREQDSTKLAVKRTNLALERSYLATERTLQAWIRTALSMISFGFTIGKLGEALGSVSVKVLFGKTAGIEGVAYFLVILGTVSLLVAAVQNRLEVIQLIRMGLNPRPSLAFYLAVLLSLVGGFAFTSMVVKL